VSFAITKIFSSEDSTGWSQKGGQLKKLPIFMHTAMLNLLSMKRASVRSALAKCDLEDQTGKIGWVAEKATAGKSECNCYSLSSILSEC